MFRQASKKKCSTGNFWHINTQNFNGEFHRLQKVRGERDERAEIKN